MTVQTHTLSNGFRIVTELMPSMKSASLGIWINAGGRHERADQNGIAHFLEHMAFKGTKRRSALQIAEEIEDVGGYINAYTSREMTAYYARVLEEDVDLGLDLIADILLNPVFDEREIEVERGVILQEIGQALDTPDDIVFDWLQEVAYPDQPMGRSILGPAERVRQFGRQDLTGFIGEHYGPGQMILAAAGKVDHDHLCREAERLFGHLDPVNINFQTEPAIFGGGERREHKRLEQVHFALALEGPDYRDPAIYTAQVYATALGGGMSSRLFQELRENRGLCYTIFAQAGAYADAGLTTIYAGTAADQIESLAHLTIDEMKKAADTLTEPEIARARAQMKAGMLMGLESPSNRAERLARMISIWGRVPTIDETVERIDGVTRTAVHDFAAHMAGQAGTALALYGPIETAPSLDSLRERFAA
ncbi:M16 family metallopeptidase [Pelagovum pacificum]|uniref:Insulinase family protein n=1 Tax=Pelagovum pacificum TaxID=2588711 RepID=A0A5C5GEU6_9RHOB|nr:pitrilysin family protein [Pelagovum pacificum]QQA44137.1 insulinase family protein [Pelagovum pacificum]TNY32734.1 insulinase family protein [Pelagovum pacificum]